MHSDDSLSEAALALGEALLAQGDLPGAIAQFARAVKLAPESPRARFALGRAWLELGEAERALECLSPLAASDAEAARLRGEAHAMQGQPRAPASYVRHLFDQFSHHYDARMTGELAYRAPAILRGLCEFVGAAAAPPCDILDMGCGTGLSGESFKTLAGVLDGIDLSPAMLARARERGLYDSLILGDIETALGAAGRFYDLVIAADSLVYLGDLCLTFAGVAARLKPNGFFLFTVEKKDGDGFERSAKRRYRHSETYLRSQAARAGLEVMGVIACSPRDEAKRQVEGLAVALQRPDSPGFP